MSEHLKVNQQTFAYERAKRVMVRWVESIGDPQLNWAWEAVCGVVDVYAGLSMTTEVSFLDGQAQTWRDWLGVFDGNAANIGVLGVYDEFVQSVPDDYHSDIPRVVTLAVECATTRRAARKGESTALKTELVTVPLTRPEPKTPTYLKLIVNNVEGA